MDNDEVYLSNPKYLILLKEYNFTALFCKQTSQIVYISYVTTPVIWDWCDEIWPKIFIKIIRYHENPQYIKSHFNKVNIQINGTSFIKALDLIVYIIFCKY